MIEIIPAIDLIDGKCVRLSQGDFSTAKSYSDDPIEMAQRFETAGLKRLHLVDLDGARSGDLSNLHVLEAIAKCTDLTIDFGGGIKTSRDVRSVFDAGAAIAGIGSLAVTQPDEFFSLVEHYGGERIMLGADVRDGKLFVDGWQTVTAIEIIPFLLRCFANRVRQVSVTDIARDGLLIGPSIDLYRQIRDALPEIKVIASGGVSSMKDIYELEDIGCHAVIVGRAIYEGKVGLDELVGSGR